MELKWHRYNYLFEKENHYFLYNSLTNSFALLNQETYELLCDIRNGRQSMDKIEEDVLSVLHQMQAINVNEEEVVNQIRFISQKSKFDETTLYLTLNPTLACNFKCPYCFEHTHPDIFMNDDVEESIVSFVRSKLPLRKLNVMWFGGEPLLGFKRIESLSRKLKEMVENYSASMITNGYLLNQEIIASLEDLRIAMIQVTLDGLADTHDQKRCLKSGGPTFDKIIANIKNCLKFAPRVKIVVRVNIDRNNEEDYQKVVEYFKSNGIEGVDIVPGFIVDRDSDCLTCAFNHKQIIKFACDLFHNNHLIPIRFFSSLSRNSCGACNSNTFVIGPEGELYKCWEEVGRRECVVGNLRNSSGNKGHLLRYVSGIDQFDDPECVQCGLLPVCDGGCPRVRLLNKYEGRNLETCHLLKDGMEDMLYCHFLTKNSEK